jgi:preprotein translocase subunit SecD
MTTLEDIYVEIKNLDSTDPCSISEAVCKFSEESGEWIREIKANNHQLSVLLNGGYKFKYYTELNDPKNRKNEIQNRLRDNKLNELLK